MTNKQNVKKIYPKAFSSRDLHFGWMVWLNGHEGGKVFLHHKSPNKAWQSAANYIKARTYTTQFDYIRGPNGFIAYRDELKKIAEELNKLKG
jgi:hypothetical protein